MRLTTYAFLLAGVICVQLPGLASGQASSTCLDGRACSILEDFERFTDGGLPTGWYTYQDRKDVQPVTGLLQTDLERFTVMQEGGNKFVRATVRDNAHRIILRGGDGMDWDVSEQPVLSWRWRAHELPVGAREDRSKLNDTGAAVYVLFDQDWLGRPRGIKYSYSSTMPAGYTDSYGALKLLVVSSWGEDGLGHWIQHQRNVREDFERLFGRQPPDKPTAVFLWSDSDSVDGVAVVDFDDLQVSRRP
ncbi:MAG: hypothetical protein ACI9W4_000009 [Rhodothermales bacterium]|jgi:hypothetical protein